MRLGQMVKKTDEMWWLTYRCGCGIQMSHSWPGDEDPPDHRACDFVERGCGRSMWLIKQEPPLNSRHFAYRWAFKTWRWFQWYVLLAPVRRRNRRNAKASDV
jgi:hypothetical protein